MERLKYFLLFVGFLMAEWLIYILAEFIVSHETVSILGSVEGFSLANLRQMVATVLLMMLSLVWIAALLPTGLCLVGTFSPQPVDWVVKKLDPVFAHLQKGS